MTVGIRRPSAMYYKQSWSSVTVQRDTDQARSPAIHSHGRPWIVCMILSLRFLQLKAGRCFASHLLQCVRNAAMCILVFELGLVIVCSSALADTSTDIQQTMLCHRSSRENVESVLRILNMVSDSRQQSTLRLVSTADYALTHSFHTPVLLQRTHFLITPVTSRICTKFSIIIDNVAKHLKVQFTV